MTIKPLDNQSERYTERFEVWEDEICLAKIVFNDYYGCWHSSIDNYKKEYPCRDAAVNDLFISIKG